MNNTKPFRSLENYKLQQAEFAKKKGLYSQLMACTTLTAARKLLYGEGKKRSSK